MRILKKILKFIGVILIIPITYLIISLISTYIPVNNKESSEKKSQTVYLSSNGVHLEIIIAKNDLNSNVLHSQKYNTQAEFFSFGWGDKNFYVETPTWADLTFFNGFQALFLNSPTLLHVTRYSSVQEDWIMLKINHEQLKKINQYISSTFQLDSKNKKIVLPGLGYRSNDDFYEAKGNYTCFNTCNSWVNNGLKQSGIKACLWTPYDFGLLGMHKNQTP
ncbi:TIGR02117 family protein [Aquimarina sediminis]|uniref:TIGR02117 family protein n=1 Tax=Aquimarina sediminis TaxID=2070536 RepID=UPI000CA06FCB|nr:TIGR02117 family protein [Aquimarina sediminis]